MSDPMNENPSSLVEDVARVLREQLDALLFGASEDLQRAAAQISANAVAAAASGRADLVDECRAQARVLLEENRMRAVGGSWAAVEAVLGGVIRTLALVLSAGRV